MKVILNILHSIFLLSSFFTYIVCTTYQFEKSIDYVNELFIYNDTETLNICEEADYELCHSKAVYYISRFNFANKDSFKKEEAGKVLNYNKYLSTLYFHAGEIEYFGLITKKPDLLEGFKKLVIAAYYGNPGALYKMYIFLETNIISSIFTINGFENMMNEEGSLQNFIYKSSFWENFKYEDDYARKNIAFNFLYSSSISKYNTASATLAYKYFKGIIIITNLIRIWCQSLL